MRLIRSASAVVLLLVPVLAWAQSPLGDVARQEQERRKTLKEQGRLYTNKDLPRVPPATSRPPAASTEPAPSDVIADVPAPSDVTADAKPAEASADAETPAVEAEKGAPKDREHWSASMSALRETLSRNQTFADALQSRINALTTDFVNRDDPMQRAAIGADRDRALSELERLRKQLVADEQAIKDLQDEARRAGVPAGWLR